MFFDGREPSSQIKSCPLLWVIRRAKGPEMCEKLKNVLGPEGAPMQVAMTQLEIFTAAFALSSLGGLAALLRSKQSLSFRNVLAAVLYSGITGLIIALMWYKYFEGEGNVYFLLAVSGLAGIGGATVIDLVKVFVQGKLKITIEPKVDGEADVYEYEDGDEDEADGIGGDDDVDSD